MKRTMTTAGLSVLAVSAFLVTGCNKESNQTAPVASQSGGSSSTAPESGKAANDNDQALVRVISAAPDAPAVEVMADKNPVFTRVEYKDVTPYKAVPANFDDFAVKPAGQDTATPLAENSESITSGHHYTLVIFPEAPAVKADADARRPADERRADGEKTLALDVIADDLQAPSAGKARVRVINAAIGTDDVEVFLRGQKDALFDDVDFKEAIAYKEVDPVKTTIEWRTAESLLNTANPKTGDRPMGEPAAPAARADRADADRADRADRTAGLDAQPGKVLGTHTLNLEAGKSYTIVIAGNANGAKHKFDTIVVEDTVPSSRPAATN
jgi:Domain of unknown function (DUF4397)